MGRAEDMTRETTAQNARSINSSHVCPESLSWQMLCFSPETGLIKSRAVLRTGVGVGEEGESVCRSTTSGLNRYALWQMPSVCSLERVLANQLEPNQLEGSVRLCVLSEMCVIGGGYSESVLDGLPRS